MLIVRLIDECQVQMNLIVAAHWQVQEAIGAQLQTLNILELERRKIESEDYL